jgi:GDPmannose 4,6-dehydratase
MIRAIQNSQASEIYHLASQSFVGSSFDHPIAAGMVTGLGALNVLEAVRFVDPKIKFYNAATSELYGDTLKDIANESTSFVPASPYSVAKLFAFHSTRLYREAYGMFACSGILFNHESPLRGLEFVTRKITYGASRIKYGLQKDLRLGNLGAKRDWGYAKEYAEGMHLMLQQQSPNDFVMATGMSHSVIEFCDRAFSRLGLNWKDYVISVPEENRPKDVNYLRGDPSKAFRLLNWKSKTTFEELVDMMVDADIKRIKK